ncbi:Adenosine kinase [Diplonema papillatum]|nr:Adenosine kinase [Diplonema papillatum]|eukprot:gene9512-14768_t
MAPQQLFCMGNPLLDISAEVDAAFLEKYGLKPANAILAEESHMPLYKELAAKPDVVYIPGGATLNAARVAKWVGGDDLSVSYTGSVAKDEYAKILTEAAEKEGLAMPMYTDAADTPTGTCGVCVVEKERSLVANLGAACKFDVAHLAKEAVWKAVEAAGVIYISGFFLTSCAPAFKKVAEHASEKKKTLVINLSADFIINFFTEQLDSVIPHADILVGNETEARALSAKKGWGTDDVKEIAKKAQQLPRQAGLEPRVVVFTQGPDETVLVNKDGSLETFAVKPVASIVDTNGAGDAFVGGFLSQFCAGKSLKDCITVGQASAGKIIGVSGCQFSGKPDFL